MPLQCCVPVPFVLSDNVQKAIETCDIFNLLLAANSSRESEEFIRTANLPPAIIEVVFDKEGKDKVVVTYGGEKYTFILAKSIRKESIGKMMEAGESRVFFYYDPATNGVQILTSRLLDLFPDKQIECLYFNDPNRDIRSLAVFERSLQASRIVINTESVTEVDLKYVLVGFTDLKCVTFNNKTFPKKYESFPTLFEISIIPNKINITMENLQQMKTKYLEIEETNYTSVDFNIWIKNWLKDKKPDNLEYLKICKLSEVTRDDLYKGIKIYPWDYENRSQYFEVKEGVAINFQWAFDILRDDGVLASVVFEKGIFMFVVWYKRFHHLSEGCQKVEVKDFVY